MVINADFNDIVYPWKMTVNMVNGVDLVDNDG